PQKAIALRGLHRMRQHCVLVEHLSYEGDAQDRRYDEHAAARNDERPSHFGWRVSIHHRGRLTIDETRGRLSSCRTPPSHEHSCPLWSRTTSTAPLFLFTTSDQITLDDAKPSLAAPIWSSPIQNASAR